MRARLRRTQSLTRGVPLKRRSSPQRRAWTAPNLRCCRGCLTPPTNCKSIALALQADPPKALHLGREANEDTVNKLDLSRFKILAFATHGLVPGELNGLTPAGAGALARRTSQVSMATASSPWRKSSR